jgi:CBS domain
VTFSTWPGALSSSRRTAGGLVLQPAHGRGPCPPAGARPVADSSGESIGRLADVIVRLRGTDYPLVTAVVVAVGGRDIFVPIEQVIGFAGDPLRLSTKRLSLRPFDRREGEVLLRADVLGRVGADTDITDVAVLMTDYNLITIPVVDDACRLLGVITVDDVLEVALPEDWRRREAAAPPAQAMATPNYHADRPGPRHLYSKHRLNYSSCAILTLRNYKIS